MKAVKEAMLLYKHQSLHDIYQSIDKCTHTHIRHLRDHVMYGWGVDKITIIERHTKVLFVYSSTYLVYFS